MFNYSLIINYICVFYHADISANRFKSSKKWFEICPAPATKTTKPFFQEGKAVFNFSEIFDVAFSIKKRQVFAPILLETGWFGGDFFPHINLNPKPAALFPATSV